MLREPHLAALLADAVDLVLGRACALCDIPGRAICLTCLEDIRCVPAPLPLSPLSIDPTGVPSARTPASDLLPPGRYSVPYRGAASTLVLDYKERGNRALAPGLGLLLADAIDALVQHDLGADASLPLTLVPIPGHRRPRRGFAALPRLLRPTVRSLRDAGHRVHVRPLLRQVRDHGPVKRMGRDERRRAMPGSLVATRPAPRQPGHVIVVDDIVTTGSTLLEAIRALRAAGIPVAGVAAIAHSERP